MTEFKILKKSKYSRARVGVLRTPHGEIETPTLVPVATRAVVKTLTSEDVLRTKTQILIANTFHLHLRPSENIVERGGGLHKFMQWPRPLMTDSGGFQVFSLGFGHDLKIGKILKSGQKNLDLVRAGDQPQKIKITDDGAVFRSPIDGQELFIGPKESIKIQEKLGADIIFAFDECPPPNANYQYSRQALERTHTWAASCLKFKTSDQALFGIVQGGKYKKLRIESAKFIDNLPFGGYGLGGEFGSEKSTMIQMINLATGVLKEEKPRHLLGIGRPEDIPKIIQAGVDTFDCTVPTLEARHGMAFTSVGKLNFKQSKFLHELAPLDKKCGCEVCGKYSRSYIAHLARASEITALRLLTFHNLFFFNTFVENLRQKIKQGKL